MTGTPLDLTPFGGALKAIGLLYWLAVFAALALVIWKVKGWIPRLLGCAVVLAVLVLPVALHLMKRLQDQNAAQARLAAATAHFEMRCRNAGERIHRTVEGVEGVVWMKWRDGRDARDDFDQYKLSDPYGRDCHAEDCIEQLLQLESTGGRFQKEVDLRRGRFKYIESIDPADGKRYRYVGAMVPRWSDENVKKYRQENSADIPDEAYWFKHEKRSINTFSARYGITWDDVSTREDREHWIAGGSLKIVDLQTGEVIAERVGYMMDRGQGSKAGFRSPWQAAPYNACPAFKRTPGGQPFMSQRAHDFIFKALQATKGG